MFQLWYVYYHDYIIYIHYMNFTTQVSDADDKYVSAGSFEGTIYSNGKGHQCQEELQGPSLRLK